MKRAPGLLAALGLASAAAAATWTGAGTDDNWTTAANWGGTAPAAGAALTFAGSARTAPVNDFAAGTAFVRTGSRDPFPAMPATAFAITSRFAKATVPAGRYPAETGARAAGTAARRGAAGAGAGRRAAGAAARRAGAAGVGAALRFLTGPPKTTAAVHNSTAAAMKVLFM